MGTVSHPRTAILGLIAFLLLVPRLAPQQEPGSSNEETVASLAAGRVVIAVVKGAILIGTIENPIEADTRPPTPVQIASERVGVILGTVRWSSPSSQREIARLDEDLPHLRSAAVTQTPHLTTDATGAEASDLEMVGRGLLDRLNEVAQDLHSRVDMPANEPLAQFKTANKLPQILARAEADAAGADEALLLNTRGEIVEGGGSNLFWIQGGTVCTPPLASGVLAGVTRLVVLEICGRLNLPHRETGVTPADLYLMEGVFASLSSRGAVEIISLDGRALNRSPLVKKIQAAYEELVTA